jgi:hypothetical protein
MRSNPKILAKVPAGSRYSVIQRAPPLYGEPEWMVYFGGESMATGVAVFFNQLDAEVYAKWRNE